MNSEELLEKYKSAPLIARFAAVTVLGLCWPGYYYSEESKVVESSIATENQKLTEAKTKLVEQKKAKTKIPSQEKALDAADKKINQIRKSLPPSFEVHEVLRQVELAAKENSVELTGFDPQQGQPTDMYEEMKFTLRVRGKFNDVTRYIDNLLHFETLTRVNGITYTPVDLQVAGGPVPRGQQRIETLASRIAEKKANAGVNVTIEFSVFKSVGI